MSYFVLCSYQVCYSQALWDIEDTFISPSQIHTRTDRTDSTHITSSEMADEGNERLDWHGERPGFVPARIKKFLSSPLFEAMVA